MGFALIFFSILGLYTILGMIDPNLSTGIIVLISKNGNIDKSAEIKVDAFFLFFFFGQIHSTFWYGLRSEWSCTHALQRDVIHREFSLPLTIVKQHEVLKRENIFPALSSVVSHLSPLCKHVKFIHATVIFSWLKQLKTVPGICYRNQGNGFSNVSRFGYIHRFSLLLRQSFFEYVYPRIPSWGTNKDTWLFIHTSPPFTDNSANWMR